MKVRGLAAAAGLALSVLLLGQAQASTERQARYTVRDLGNLGGTITAAADVNALGQVVGFSMTTDGFLHAFLWSKGKMTDLGTLGGQSSYATGINDAGVVVGYSQLAGSQDSHAFLWRKGRGMRDLGTLGGAQSFATDVNDLGLVVGRAFDATQTPHGFAWTAARGMRQLAGDPFSTAGAAGAGADGTIGTGSGLARGFFRRTGSAAQAFGAPGQIQNSEAYAVNNARRTVGIAYNDPFGASYGWLARSPGGRMQLLADLTKSPGWSFNSPAAINDLGLIAGTGQKDGLPSGFLLTPDRSEQAASLRAFALGGRSFHTKVTRTLNGALADLSRARKRRACASLAGLATAATREGTLSTPVRGIFAADVRGFRRGLGCPGA